MNDFMPLHRLHRLAQGDTGGSRRTAQFLLSLWNGGTWKADLQELMYIDGEIFDDMLALWRYLHNHNLQLYSLISEAEMRPIIDLWGDVFLSAPRSTSA